ncbi:MAG TPA: hypothetical protein VGL53_16350 [Bryobacteraceae bacterium]|jgi:hypothetical protein
MNWGTTIGVTLLTTLAGGAAGVALANFVIYWQEISNREGSSGYLVLILTGLGLLGGFIIGLATALAVRSDFWKAQAWAVGVVVAVALFAGVLTVVLDDHGPTFDGDKIVLEVELKCPRGWTLDNRAKSEMGASCWMQKNPSTAQNDPNPFDLGGVDVDAAREVDGQIVMPVSVELAHTRKNRFLRVFIGKKTDVTFKIPLPAKPGAKAMEWTGWLPAPQDYSFRCRIQKKADFDRVHVSKHDLFEQARAKALAAMPPNAPLEKWLPFFDEDRGGARSFVGVTGPTPELDVLHAHLEALIPLLRSSDPTTIRQAVFAASQFEPLPPPIVAPMIEAGRGVVEILKAARAVGTPDDPDLVGENRAYNYFFYWNAALERSAGADAPERRAVLEAIEREAQATIAQGGSKERTHLQLVLEGARKALEKSN